MKYICFHTGKNAIDLASALYGYKSISELAKVVKQSVTRLSKYYWIVGDTTTLPSSEFLKEKSVQIAFLVREKLIIKKVHGLKTDTKHTEYIYDEFFLPKNKFKAKLPKR